MKSFTLEIIAGVTLTVLAAFAGTASRQTGGEAAPIFGIKLPLGYRDWRLISVAHEEGKLNDFRAILGNDVAIKAFREGNRPFPDGTNFLRSANSISLKTQC